MSYPKKVSCPYCMESFKNPMIKDGSVNKASQPDVCPHCKKRIPKDYLYGKVRTLYVYFIGPPSAGKTRLIGNMIMESEREFGHRGVFREWTVAPDPDPKEDVNGNKTRDFYVQHAMDIDGTSVGSTKETQIGKFPMVLYKLGSCGSILRSLADMSIRKEKVYLAFADAMGEWFTFKKLPANTQDPLSGATSKERDEYRRRFAKANAIILVTEPGHIPGLHSAYDKDENGEPVIRKTDTNIENILDFSQLLFGRTFQKVPLAITLSKFDRLFASANPVAQEFLGLFRSNSSRDWNTATDFLRDDINKITSVSEGLKAAILGSKNIELNSRARKNIREIISSYPYTSLFAISSTGMGGLRKTNSRLSPLHVLDPLVWILWQYGYLGSKLFI